MTGHPSYLALARAVCWMHIWKAYLLLLGEFVLQGMLSRSLWFSQMRCMNSGHPSALI